MPSIVHAIMIKILTFVEQKISICSLILLHLNLLGIMFTLKKAYIYVYVCVYVLFLIFLIILCLTVSLHRVCFINLLIKEIVSRDFLTTFLLPNISPEAADSHI
jgi:hypothetical protein